VLQYVAVCRSLLQCVAVVAVGEVLVLLGVCARNVQ